MIWRRWMVVVLLGLSLCQVALADTYDEATKARNNRQPKLAMQLYQQAIEQSDDGRAYNAIGAMYENGEGVVRDYKKAFEYYEKAGKRGNVYAFGNMGALYDRGLGVKRDVSFALTLYFRGLNRGDAKSINNLGVMAATGQLLPRDSRTAWALFAFAGDLGSVSAKQNLRNIQPRMTVAQLAYAQKVYQALKQAKPTARAETLYSWMDIGHDYE